MHEDGRKKHAVSVTGRDVGRRLRLGMTSLAMMLMSGFVAAWGAGPEGSGLPPEDSARDPSPHAIVQFLSPAIRAVDREEAALREQLAALPSPASGPTSESQGYHSVVNVEPAAPKWVQVDLGALVEFEMVVLVPVHNSIGSHTGPGYGFPVRFRVEASDHADFTGSRTLADHTAEPFINPGNEPVFIRVTPQRARIIRVTATELWRRGNFYTFALGELMVIGNDRNRAAGGKVTSLDSIETPRPWRRENLVDFQSILGVPVLREPSPSNGYHSREFDRRIDAEKWVEVDLGAAHPLTELRLVPARPYDWADRVGFGFPLRFKIEASARDDGSDLRTIVDFTGADFPNPGDNLVVFAGDELPARRVRVTATRHWERTRDYAFALGELQVFSGTTNVAFCGEVTATESHEGNGWSVRGLVDGYNSQNRLASLTEWLAGLERRGQLLRDLERLMAHRRRLADDLIRRLSRAAGYAVAAAVVVGILVTYRGRVVRQRELERTRARIARDMHDDLGARLTEITFLSEMARRDAGDPERARALTFRIAQCAREVVNALDELVWTVNPRNDSLERLVGYILRHAEQLFEGTPVRCRIDAPSELPVVSIPPDARHHILLIVKEALSNAVKHGKPNEVFVRVRAAADLLELRIEDDGGGLSEPAQAGDGLINMRERTAALGGGFRIEQRSAGGTAVVVSLPLPPRARWLKRRET